MARAADDAACAGNAGPAKQFRRALLFAGGGTDVGLHIGLYDAALDAGLAPDLIVASSGGALAAIIVNTYPDRRERTAFLTSPELLEMMLSLTVNQTSPVDLCACLVARKLRAIGPCLKPPRIFAKTVGSIPLHSPAVGMNQAEFPTGPQQPRLLIVAGAVEFGTTHFRRPNQKYFRETWFTDAETAARITNPTSVIGCRFPRAAVANRALVVGDAPLNLAASASIAEPHVFPPVCINGRYFTGGAINLFPVELAAALADEVIATTLQGLDAFSETLLHNVFEYLQKQRKQEADGLSVAYRVNFSDHTRTLKQSSFWFTLHTIHDKADLQAVPAWESKPHCHLLIPRLRLIDNVPEDPAEFGRRIGVQYNYGYSRAAAAFAHN